MIGFCSSPRFVEHLTGPHHPERPDRIRAIYTAMHRVGWIQSNPFPDFELDLGPLTRNKMRIFEIEPRPADVKWAELVHTPAYVERLRHVAQIGGVLDQGDTPVMSKSYEIALLALGGVLRCCDAVMRRDVERAFAAIRPPGHHAEPDRAMGFCLFSNVAIAARYLQQVYRVKRVAVVDFDVHHGNGTQAALEADPSIYFVSMHQHPLTCYPGSGYDWETGAARGNGYTMNIPFDPGADDADYLNVLDKRIIPELDDFAPQVLLISAGFDAHMEDPLAQIELSEEGYELITRSLCALADRHCRGRVISVLEGGYNLRSMSRSILRHLIGMT